MRGLVVVVALGCGGGPHRTVPDAPSPAPLAYGERCGNGIDDDGDGLIDEDCQPSLFGGVYAPGVAGDPALAAIEAAIGRPLSVLQTYHSTSPIGVARIAPDLAAIFARGQVAHLNVEPDGYPDYSAPTADPIAHDLAATAAAIAGALAAAPKGRVLLTFGAEMNGSWTTWGCLPAATYIALYRAAHDAVAAALATAGVEPRRVRWAYGPNSTSSANCGSTAGYYPGHGYVDLLGMSAYRTATASVDSAVISPMSALFDALAYPAAWQHDRFVVLQTGSRDMVGDDRSAWIAALIAGLLADQRAAGIIYFDSADWAIAVGGAGWSGLTTSLAATPAPDDDLDGVFTPHFWDVPYDHAAFPEIQALRDAAVTTGCAADPPRFCPDDAITAADATTMLARAGFVATLADPVLETELAAALGTTGSSTAVTRARAAVMIAHAARLVPHAL